MPLLEQVQAFTFEFQDVIFKAHRIICRRYNFSVMSFALLKINTELQNCKTFFSLEDFSLFKIVKL